jgi:predicted phosphodiesterase
MKYAILSDIHANLEALETVLDDAQKQQCAQYACAGDVVGGGANPRECLALVRRLNMACVKGEYDEYCSVEGEVEDFGPLAAEAIRWTRRQLDPEERAWLWDLKYVRLVGSFSLVHATLDGPQRWGCVFDKLMAAASFTYQNTDVCFFGHTQVPVAFVRDSVVQSGTYSRFRVEPNRKYFVNVGSVGQPSDGNPRAGYVAYDLDEGSIELRRLDYDIPKAQKKILAAGLPQELADGLAGGKSCEEPWMFAPPTADSRSPSEVSRPVCGPHPPWLLEKILDRIYEALVMNRVDHPDIAIGAHDPQADTQPPRRPTGVTILAWIYLALALFYLVSFLLVATGTLSELRLSASLVLHFVCGLLVNLTVGVGFLSGQRLARWLFLIAMPLFMVISLATSGFSSALLPKVGFYTLVAVYLNSIKVRAHFRY